MNRSIQILYQYQRALLASVMLVAILAVTACEQQEPELTGSIDREGQPLQVTVYFHDSKQDIRKSYAQVHGVSLQGVSQGLEGFAVWPEWRGTEPQDAEYTCDVYVQRPRNIDDTHTLTLGHEMLHCLIGSYHD